MKLKLGKLKFRISLIPSVSLMDRYIAAELTPPFLFGVGAFSSVGVAAGTLFDLVRQVSEFGLPLGTALQVLLMQSPRFAAYAFPMSTLLAVMIVYSRLSSDSELIALRSCGISLYRLVAPALVLSLLVTGMTFLFNELVVPAANHQTSNLLKTALNLEKPSLHDNNILYPEYETITKSNGQEIQKLKRLFYANQFDGKRMKDLTVLDLSKQGLNQVVTSESAIWNPAQGTWDFFNGTIYLISPNASQHNILRFENQQLKLPRAPLDLTGKDFQSDEMNIIQIMNVMEIARVSGEIEKLRKFELRIHQKLSFPFVCLVFGIVGAALGTRPQRTGKATSFGISIVLIFGYYLFGFITDALGLSGILSPFVAAWLPNLLGLGAGGWLLVQAAR